jgi:hypothetical protein
MIVHRDYQAQGDSTIKIFDDRIECFNPGPLPKGVKMQDILSGTIASNPRNKQIASIFKEAGMIEKYGSGIIRVMQSMADAGAPAPVFEIIANNFKVIHRLVVQLFFGSGLVSKNSRQEFRKWLTAYLQWLLTSPQGKAERAAKNNHGTCYDLQVLAIASFLGKKGIAYNTIVRALLRLSQQFTPDGSQPEELTRNTLEPNITGSGVYRFTKNLAYSLSGEGPSRKARRRGGPKEKHIISNWRSKRIYWPGRYSNLSTAMEVTK